MCGAINVVTTSCNITTNVEKNNTFHKLKFLSNKNARVISILPYLFYVEKNSIKIVTNLKKQGFSKKLHYARSLQGIRFFFFNPDTGK